MRLYPKRALAGVSAFAIAGGLALAGAGSALAAGPAPWEPDPNAQGQLTLTDANGVPITGGNVSDVPIANFGLGSTPGRTGDTKAVLFYYLPVKGVNSLNWNGGQVDGLTVYNPGSALPPNLASTGLPVNTDTSGTASVQTMINTFPNDSTANSDPAWQNQYEIRLKTNGPSGTNTAYDAADILVTGSTWVLEPQPAATVQTTTTLTPSPANPDITSANPAPVTLTTTVTPAGSLPTGFTGSPGVVQIKNGSTIVATVSIAPGAATPYHVTTNLSLANPSTENWVATFYPDNGSALVGSSSTAVPYQVEAPADTTAITLGVTAGPHAGDNVTYSGTVTDATTPATTVNAGTVNLFDNGSSAPLNPTPLAVSAGAYTFSNTFASAGSHSIVAVYSGVAGQFLGATSAPATFSQSPTPGNPCDPAVGGQCTDVQTITGKVPTGVLSIATPYTASHPLDLGTLALDPTDTYFTAAKQFGNSTTDPTQDILITDTRAGNLPWTAQAQAANLSDGGVNPGSSISGENVGLTSLTVVPVSGNGFDGTSANFTTVANGAANPPVAPADAGFAGLGNEAHRFAYATHGLGSVGLLGTLTLNAPSSTEAGQFTGTITFTLVGAIVANAH